MKAKEAKELGEQIDNIIAKGIVTNTKGPFWKLIKQETDHVLTLEDFDVFQGQNGPYYRLKESITEARVNVKGIDADEAKAKDQQFGLFTAEATREYLTIKKGQKSLIVSPLAEA